MLSVEHLSDHRMFRGLPDPELGRIVRSLESVELVPGEVVGEPGKRLAYAYFLRRGVISVFAGSDAGPGVGVGLIVTHGLFGLSVVANGKRSGLFATSQGYAAAYRIKTSALAEQIELNAGLGRRVFRYGMALLTQFALTTACIGRHTSTMRLARWMLDVSDGHGTASFSSTQDAMGSAIGVQRAVVSKAAGSFQALGLIRYARGEVTVLDRSGLGHLACSCSIARLRFA